MPRRRLAAAVLLPPPWAAEVDGLRRACGDALLDRVAPHVTLVSPINVAAADLAATLAVVRAAATAVAGPLRLHVGPATTFHPASPVLYLAVDGQAVVDGTLVAVHDALHAGPLARPPTWPFAPHVTLTQDQPAERLLAGVAALADYRATVTVDRIHLLEERPDEGGRRVWTPIADAVLGPRVVVARGSLSLELTTGGLVDPEAAERLSGTAADDTGSSPAIVVTARRADTGEVVGVAIGPADAADDPEVVVHPDAQGEGVADHLVARWAWTATRGAPEDRLFAEGVGRAR